VNRGRKLAIASTICGLGLQSAIAFAQNDAASVPRQPEETTPIPYDSVIKLHSAQEGAQEAASIMKKRARAAAEALAPPGTRWRGVEVSDAQKTAQGIVRQGSRTARVLKGAKVIDDLQDGVQILTPIAERGLSGVTDSGQQAIDVVANNKAAEWTGAACGRWGMCAGARFGPGWAVVGGVVGYAVGAVAGSATYKYVIKPRVKPVIKAAGEALAEQSKVRERITSLNVVGPNSAEPGEPLTFTAQGTVELDLPPMASGLEGPAPSTGGRMTVKLPGTQNLTEKVAWNYSGGFSSGPGQVTVDCSAEGGRISVDAIDHASGLRGQVSVSVGKLKLNDLMLTVGREVAKPGESIPVRVNAYYGNRYCSREVTVLPGDLSWEVSEGGAVLNDALRIAAEKKSGVVTLSVKGPNNVSSGTRSVRIEEPRLERIAISVPPEVKPCDVVTPSAVGFYSDDPGTPRAVQGLRWSFAGRYTPRGNGAARADWPDSILTVTASAPSGAAEISQTTDVKVGPLGRKIPWFPIENVTIVSRITVGSGFVAKAIEFSCDEGARPARNVRWSSSAPGILACSATGECTGLAAGVAVVSIEYEGRTVTGQNVKVDPLPQQPVAATPTADDAPAVKPAKTCTHWSDCPPGYVCEGGQCVTKPELSVACSPQVVKVGQPVNVSVGATYADRGYIDVTGTAKLSRSNPFVPTDAGTYVVSANYQGVIGRCAVKVEGDKPSPCPGDQVRATDGSCVPVSSVEAVTGTYRQRQSDRDKSATPLPGTGVGSLTWPPGAVSGERGGRAFGSDSLRDAINRGMKDAAGGGQRDTRSDAGTQEQAGGGGGSGGGTGTQAGGGSSGTGTPTPPVKQPTTPVAEKEAWYQFRWVMVRSKPDCRVWTQTVYNNAYLIPSEISQYIDYVKRQMPTLHVGIAPSATFVSGTVTQVAGPLAKAPAYPGDSITCSN
jgi:hypothetical protein